MTDDDTQALTVMMTEVATKIQVLLDKQDELADNISKIKEALFDPDQGLYARLRELESWKASSSRLIWIIISAMVGLTSLTIWQNLISS